MNAFDDNEKLDFGSQAEVDHLLQQGMAAHFGDRVLAERFFLAAIALAPDVGLPGKAEAMIARVIAMAPDDAVGGSVVAALLEETLLAI